ncbi:MAG TPA: hypothetical protein VE691_15080 [Rubrobacter sp.]|nr:hypothetical protein [Rubrobacter sp.]
MTAGVRGPKFLNVFQAPGCSPPLKYILNSGAPPLWWYVTGKFFIPE